MHQRAEGAVEGAIEHGAQGGAASLTAIHIGSIELCWRWRGAERPFFLSRASIVLTVV